MSGAGVKLHNNSSEHDRITIDPENMDEKPVVTGTRIPVERVPRHLEENDRTDLFAAFPELTEDDARSCLAYARDAIAQQLHPTPNGADSALPRGFS